MIVIIMEKVPLGLRGELTRWLLEAHTGVFVGHVSAMVREQLWAKCCEGVREGGVIQAWNTNTEQRFFVRTYGVTKRQLMDFEGLQLFRTPYGDEERAEMRRRLRGGWRAPELEVSEV
jgi:CRISPR-associated protein Cas2